MSLLVLAAIIFQTVKKYDVLINKEDTIFAQGIETSSVDDRLLNYSNTGFNLAFSIVPNNVYRKRNAKTNYKEFVELKLM